MADNVIREVVQIDGNPRGGVQALKAVASQMDRTEKSAGSVAQRLQGYGQKLSGYGRSISDFFKSAGRETDNAAKSLNQVNQESRKSAGPGGILGMLKAIPGPAIAAAAVLAGIVLGIKAIAGELGRFKEVRASAEKLSQSFDVVKSKLLSPFAHLAIAGMEQLNRLFSNKDVLFFIDALSSLIQAGIKPLISWLKAGVDAVIQFAHVLRTDPAKAGAAVADMVFNIATSLANLAQNGFAWGFNLIAEFAQGMFDAAAQIVTTVLNAIGNLIAGFLEGHSPPKKGPLRTIDRWGAALLNAFLSGFNKADFSVLDKTLSALRERLQTFVDLGDAKQEGVIPSLIGAQSVVARALAEMKRTGELSQATIEQVRAGLAGLGKPTQDFVEGLLRAEDATRKVLKAQTDLNTVTTALGAAQDNLKGKEAALNALLEQQEKNRRAQNDELKTLRDLEDGIRDDEQALAELIKAQIPERQRLERLVLEEAAAQKTLNDLVAQQEAALKALDPLRSAAAAAAKEEAALQETISERQRIAGEAIADANNAFQDRMEALQATLENVGSQYKRELDQHNKLIKAVDAKWAREIEGATEAYDIAKRAFDLEERRNKKAQAGFLRQRAAAQQITDPNQRIAALARIDRAADKYNARNKDALELARVEAELKAQSLDEATKARDDEKKGSVERIDAINKLIEDERALLQEKINKEQKAGEARLKAMARAEAAQQRIEAGELRAAAAKTKAASDAVTNAEQEIRNRTDGAIEAERINAAAAAKAASDLQTLLDAEKKPLETRITTAREEASLRRSYIDEKYEKEGRLLEDRILAAQDEVKEAGKLVTQKELEVAAAEKVVKAAQKVVEKYVEMAEEAQARIAAEAQIAALLKEQDILLKQMADKAAGGGAGAGAGAGRVGGGKVGGGGVPDLKLKPSEDLIPPDLSKIFDEAIKGFWERFVQKAEETFPGITKAWNDTVAVWNSPDLSWLEKGGSILRIIAELLDKQQGLAGFVDFFQSVERFVENPAKEFGQWIEDLKNSGSPAGEAVKFIDGALNNLATGASAASNNLAGFMNEAANKIGTFFADVGTTIETKSKEAWTSVTTWFNKTKDDASTAVEETRTNVVNKFNELKEGVTNKAQETWQNATNKFEEIKTGLTTKVGDTWTAVTTKWEEIKTGVTTKATELWTSVTTKFEEIKTGVTTKTTEAWTAVTTKWEEIKTGVTNKVNEIWTAATTKFQEITTAVTTRVGEIWTAVTTKFQEITTAVTTRLGEISTAVTTKFGEIKQTITDRVTEAWTAVTTKFGEMKDAVVNRTTEAWSGATGKFGEMKTSLVNTASSIWTEVTSFFGNLKRDVENKVKDMADNVTGFFTGLYQKVVGNSIVPDMTTEVIASFKTQNEDSVEETEKLKKDAEAKFTKLKDIIVLAAGVLKAEMTGLFMDISDTSDTFWTDAGKLAVNGITTMKTIILSPLQAISQLWYAFFGTGDDVKEEPTNLWGMLASHSNGIFPKISEYLEFVLNYIKTSVLKARIDEWALVIVTALQDVKDQLRDGAESLGQAIGDAIAIGIGKAAEAVKAAARGLVGDAKTAAEQEAGIASPAKKWIPIGTNSALGFIVGLLSKAKDAGRAGAQLLNTAANAMQGRNLNPMLSLAGGINLPVATSVAAYASATSLPSAGAGVARVQHVNIGAQYVNDVSPANDLAEQAHNALLFSGK